MAVRVAEQVRALPESVATSLTFSHHKALLCVKDFDKKVELAERVRDAGLSTRALQVRISALTATPFRGKTKRAATNSADRPKQLTLTDSANKQATASMSVGQAMENLIAAAELTCSTLRTEARSLGAAPELARLHDAIAATTARLDDAIAALRDALATAQE